MKFGKKLAILPPQKNTGKPLHNKKYLKAEKEHKRSLLMYLDTSNID